MIQSNPKQSSLSENVNAIATLLNSELESFGVTTELTLDGNQLLIIVNTPQPQASKPILNRLQKTLKNIPLDPNQKLIIQWQIGEHPPAWQQEFDLTQWSSLPEKKESFWESMTHRMGNIGHILGDRASDVGETIKNISFQTAQGASSTANQVGQWFGQATTLVINNPLLERIINRVDLLKAEEALKRLQEQYPDETPRQIAHRLMGEKAIYAGSSGLASSFLPGVAAGLIALDLAAVAALQAEMIFQIGGAYGLDLKDPARKGEVLAIFGLSLGGSHAVKAGLGLIRTAPGLGAVIGASTNATMMFALGYAACQFYETKLQSTINQEELKTVQEESDRYLKDNLSQQAVMDQILVHLALAGHPGKTWDEILPELEPLNLSPVSLKLMQDQSQSPTSVEDLLEQINEDFAVSLLAQCQKISQFDQMVTPEEAQILEKIETKLKPTALSSHLA